MKSFIDSNIIITQENKKYFNARIFNLEHSDNINENKYEKLTLGLNEEAKKGQLVLAKVFENKPARLIQWIKSSETILFEIFHSKDNKDWKFSHEYTLTYDDLKNFAPIYEYSLNIFNEVKKELADSELSGTSFLTRD